MSAVKAEAKGSGIELEFDGEAYSLPPAVEWDLTVLESLEDGRVVNAARAIVGPEAWARFKSKRRTAKDLSAFLEAIIEAAGLGN